MQALVLARHRIPRAFWWAVANPPAWALGWFVSSYVISRNIDERFPIFGDSAPQRQEAGPVVDLRDELDGYTVTFTSLLEDIDATPFMKGLPDDRCQCPHWGYVIKGKMTARYADRDEVFEAGDAFYTPPGHVPVTNEPGTEFVSFSPAKNCAVMMKNMQAMQEGSTPWARRALRRPLPPARLPR
jgi:hypothetical protein